MKSMTKLATVVAAGLLGGLLVGCAGTPEQEWSTAAQNKQTATGVKVTKSEIGVPTKPSVEYIRIKTERSIFLDPPEDNVRVYVRIGDTSGRDWGNVNLRAQILESLRQRGYEPVRSAKRAAYTLQANIRLAEEVSAAELAKLDETQYGSDVTSVVRSALQGALIGGLGTGATGGDADAVLAGSVGGAIIGGVVAATADRQRRKLLLAQQTTKFFSLVVDLELRERASGTVTRSGKSEFSASQGSSGSDTLSTSSLSGGQRSSFSETETYTEQSSWKRHRTRMLGKAKGKLVVFEDVQQDFVAQMARAIAGLF